MPQSRSSTPKAGQPASDSATYRDLLLFEERLKTNAARLRRRKRRYQVFLLHLVTSIFILASDVLLATNLVAWPINRIIQELPITPTPNIVLPQYITQSAFLVAITTLILFYASGLYAEKIGYANRYVPHANRALRSFNMYLNVRSQPLSVPWPINLITGSRVPLASPVSPQPIPRGRTEASRGGGRRITTIPPIPPSSNPRGELIFTSRVDKHFRESYERYRAAFERKRDARVLADAEASALWWRWLPGSNDRLTKELSSEKDAKDPNRSPTGSKNSSRSTTPIESLARAAG